MKKVMKIMIVLGVVLIFLGMIVGCEQKGSGEEKNKEVSKSEKGVLGKYVNQDDPREYVELKSDYTVYKKEKFPWGDYYEMKGKWETGSDEVLFIGPLGGVDRCKIKSNTLIDEDGKIWTKQGETRIITKETSSGDKISRDADNIPGRYIIELVKKDGTTEKSPGVMIFKRDGRLALSSSGQEFVIPDQKWELKNGAVHIYQYFSDEPRRQEILFGELKGSTIICKRKDDKEVDEFRYIYTREDGRLFSLTSSANSPKPESSSQNKEKTKPKSMYDSWEGDEKRLRAEPATELKFKKLSAEDEIQARQLWEWVVSQRKMARLPVVGYGQMVKTCRDITRRWPESEYAFKAKRALTDLPKQYRKQYNITDEEIDL